MIKQKFGDNIFKNCSDITTNCRTQQSNLKVLQSNLQNNTSFIKDYSIVTSQMKWNLADAMI